LKIKYRSREEAYASILENTARQNTGIGVTRLMYSSYLSYSRTISHLEFLLKEGMLNYDDSVKLYKITPKGRQFLSLYSEMAQLLEAVA
jgi:predicted transcriptional regulator